jgi:glycosyltransferase involved in cell wall biosynthesis
MWRIKVFIKLILDRNIQLALGKAKAFVFFKFRSNISWKKRVTLQSVQLVELAQEEFQLEKPIVSVIVPHHNYARYLVSALESIMNSTLPMIEVIVIESGSDVEDLKFVTQLAKENEDPRIKFVFKEKNRLGFNRNLGVELAQSNLLCSFDPDDVMDEWYLEVASFHAVARCLDVSGASTLTFGNESKNWDLPEIVNLAMLTHQNCVSSHAIFNRKIWTKVGGFKDSPESGFFLHEDWRFWSEASSLGARIRNVPGRLIKIRIHGKNMSRNPELLSDYKQGRLIRRILQTRYMAKKESMIDSQREMHLSQSGLSKYATIIANKRPTSQEEVILVFLPWLDKSGAGKVFSTIASSLKNQKLRFLVVSTELMPSHARRLEVGGVLNFRMQESLPPGLQRDFVTYLINSRKVKTIWQMGSNWFYQNCDYLVLKDVRVIDSIFNTKSLHILNHIKFNQCFEYAVFESEEAKLDYFKFGGRSTALLAPNGINIEEEVNLEETERDIDLLFLGRLAPEKDPFAFIAIAEKLLANNPTLKICIAGDGPLTKSIREKLNRRRSKIEVLGHIDDSLALLRRTRIVAVTSTPVEGRPNTIFEAIREGAVVVSYDVGSIRSIIHQDSTGLLCRHGDQEKMVEGIELLLERETRRVELAKSALDLVRSNHSWQQAIETYERVLGWQETTTC